MADYRRHLAGRLRYAYLARLPLAKDLTLDDADPAFTYDPWLRDHLHGLVDRARAPELLARCLDASGDEPIDPVEHERAATIGRLFVALEGERDEARRIAEQPAPKPPRLRDDWRRVIRRTGRALRRRLPGSR